MKLKKSLFYAIWFSLACLGCKYEPFPQESTDYSQVLNESGRERKAWTKIPSSDFDLLPPPTQADEAFKRDFDLLKAHQATRSTEDCDRAKQQKFPTFSAFFKDREDLISSEDFLRLENLMDKVNEFSERVANYHKERFERKRPYDTDHSIKPCIPKVEGSRSYPSSHATIAAADACILAKIFPVQENTILSYGNYLGDLRVIVGVHHPSDVEAGQKLGEAICERLWLQSSFQTELKNLKD